MLDYHDADGDGVDGTGWECEVIDDEMHCRTQSGDELESIESGSERVDRLEDDTCETLGEIFIQVNRDLSELDTDDLDSDEQRTGVVGLVMMHEGMRSTLEHGCPEFHS